MVRKVTINGVRHEIVTNPDGTEQWNPPKPDGWDDECKSRFLEMIASRCPPGANTDTVFMSGRPRLRESFGGDERSFKKMLTGARKHGYEPKSTDVYFRSIAKFPGDPEAFFNAGDGMGKVKKICEKRGVGCEGAVTVNSPSAKKDAAERPSKKQACA